MFKPGDYGTTSANQRAACFRSRSDELQTASVLLQATSCSWLRWSLTWTSIWDKSSFWKLCGAATIYPDAVSVSVCWDYWMIKNISLSGKISHLVLPFSFCLVFILLSDVKLLHVVLLGRLLLRHSEATLHHLHTQKTFSSEFAVKDIGIETDIVEILWHIYSDDCWTRVFTNYTFLTDKDKLSCSIRKPVLAGRIKDYQD